MKTLVLDQCSGSKEVTDSEKIFRSEAIDTHGREALLSRNSVAGMPACELYTGEQQQFIDSAVEQLRDYGDAVDRKYVSAGFGLVDETTELPPYEVTFKNMGAAEIDARADRLGLPSAVRDAIDSDPAYDVVVFALGSDYFRACDIETVLAGLAQETIGAVFSQEEVAQGRENVVSIPAGPTVAGEHGTIAVAVKGRYLQYFAGHRSQGRSVNRPDEVAEMFATDPS